MIRGVARAITILHFSFAESKLTGEDSSHKRVFNCRVQRVSERPFVAGEDRKFFIRLDSAKRQVPYQKWG